MHPEEREIHVRIAKAKSAGPEALAQERRHQLLFTPLSKGRNEAVARAIAFQKDVDEGWERAREGLPKTLDDLDGQREAERDYREDRELEWTWMWDWERAHRKLPLTEFERTFKDWLLRQAKQSRMDGTLGPTTLANELDLLERAENLERDRMERSRLTRLLALIIHPLNESGRDHPGEDHLLVIIFIFYLALAAFYTLEGLIWSIAAFAGLAGAGQLMRIAQPWAGRNGRRWW